MENLMNINTAAALYVQHFNIALVNFEKQVKEEKLSRISRISRKIRKHSQTSSALS